MRLWLSEWRHESCRAAQQVVEVAISMKENAIYLASNEPGFTRKLEMPSGVTIKAVWPKLPAEGEGTRRFLLLPVRQCRASESKS